MLARVQVTGILGLAFDGLGFGSRHWPGNPAARVGALGASQGLLQIVASVGSPGAFHGPLFL